MFSYPGFMVFMNNKSMDMKQWITYKHIAGRTHRICAVECRAHDTRDLNVNKQANFDNSHKLLHWTNDECH